MEASFVPQQAALPTDRLPISVVHIELEPMLFEFLRDIDIDCAALRGDRVAWRF